MVEDGGVELIEVRLRRVLPFRDSAAVVLEAPGKNFMIFVGLPEAMAMSRLLDGQESDRPLTHDLLAFVMSAFDIEVKKVVVSSIVESVFCATLTLVQHEEGRPPQELRLDARASDSIVIALKHGQPIWVTQRVLDEVEDVTEAVEHLESQLDGSSDGDELTDEGPAES